VFTTRTGISLARWGSPALATSDKRFLDSDVRHCTVALAPAAPVTSATLLSNDMFKVIPLSAAELASHSSPAFAHLYHARPGP